MLHTIGALVIAYALCQTYLWGWERGVKDSSNDQCHTYEHDH